MLSVSTSHDTIMISQAVLSLRLGLICIPPYMLLKTRRSELVVAWKILNTVWKESDCKVFAAALSSSKLETVTCCAGPSLLSKHLLPSISSLDPLQYPATFFTTRSNLSLADNLESTMPLMQSLRKLRINVEPAVLTTGGTLMLLKGWRCPASLEKLTINGCLLALVDLIWIRALPLTLRELTLESSSVLDGDAQQKWLPSLDVLMADRQLVIRFLRGKESASQAGLPSFVSLPLVARSSP